MKVSVKNGGFWLAALLALILDQLTKAWAVRDLLPKAEIPFWPGVFHLTYVENSGAAWSLFANGGGFLRWVSLGVSLALMAMAIWGGKLSRWEQAGYGLILAGALGNGIDRFVNGYVVDFLNFILIQFPVFNLADVAINVGVFCLILDLIRKQATDPTIGNKPADSGKS